MQKNKTTFNVKSDALEIYFADIKGIPLLTIEEEQNLCKRILEGDKSAKERLINANLRLVVKIANFYNVVDPSLRDDIIQEGNFGLIHAIDKYDPSKNTRFATYASHWIRQYISRFLSDKRRDIHLPHRKEECLKNFKKKEQMLSQRLMRQPTIEEIAEEMNIPSEELQLILNITASHIPLEGEGVDEETSAIEVCEDYTYNPEIEFFNKYFQTSMLKIFQDRLSWKERTILKYRYELNGCEKYTLRKIGNKMQISPETVRQIEKKALKKIRAYSEELQELAS